MSNEDMIKNAKAIVEETVNSLRYKPIKSTTFDRLCVQYEADKLTRDIDSQVERFPAIINYIFSNAKIPLMPHDILLGRVEDRVLTDSEEAKMQEMLADKTSFDTNFIPCWLRDFGHCSLIWEDIVALGLGGLIKKAEASALKIEAEHGEPQCADNIRAAVKIYKAFQTYISRYAEAASKAGLTEAADCCTAIISDAPQTFREAIQLVLFIGIAYSCLCSFNATLCFGRMDNYLLPFYSNDIAAGRLTVGQAGALIEDFYAKQSLILGRGEHQLSRISEGETGWTRNPMYDSPQYVILGGYSEYDHVTNPLTRLFLEHIVPRFENPVVIFRYTADVDEKLWNLIIDKLRQNSALFIYNDETMIKAFEHVGISPKDAVNYTLHGCNWSDVGAKSSSIRLINAFLPGLVMEALCVDTDAISSVEDICSRVESVYRARVVEARNDVKKIIADMSHGRPTISITRAFTAGYIESGIDLPIYPVCYNLLRFVATAADMLASIKYVVYDKKMVSLKKLLDICKENFVGYPEIYNACQSAPKFGNDDDAADMWGSRLMRIVQQVLDEESFDEDGTRVIIPLNTTNTDMSHLGVGGIVGATPDGRLANKALSENLSATAGKAVSGLTALFNSEVKLPFDNVHSGALNIRVRKSFVNGAEGLERLAMIIKTYFEQGGIQVQMTVADTDELKKAQLEPENYRDLMVRITGYSAVFVDMSRVAQNEIIRRDELN